LPTNFKKPHHEDIQIGDEGSIVSIPYDKLPPSTLRAIIEEFVTRDGTDYGDYEVPFEQKISQVNKELVLGNALILFDTKEEICNIVAKDDPSLKEIIGKT
jgi:hypothetical protein